MSSPKHYPTFRVAVTEALSTSLDVSDPDAETNEDHSIVLCKGYGYIDSGSATDDYFIQFLQGPTLPGNGVVTHFATPITIGHTSGVTSEFEFDFGPDYVKCKSGLWIVVSTTRYLKTIVTSGVMDCTVFYH